MRFPADCMSFWCYMRQLLFASILSVSGPLVVFAQSALLVDQKLPVSARHDSVVNVAPNSLTGVAVRRTNEHMPSGQTFGRTAVRDEKPNHPVAGALMLGTAGALIGYRIGYAEDKRYDFDGPAFTGVRFFFLGGLVGGILGAIIGNRVHY